MKTSVSLALVGAVWLSLFSLPANAQATRTWVSGVGDDANPCSRTAPCKTYAGAISKTAPGGEINCLDPGGFGALTITKSISVVCDYSEGGVLASGINGFVINAPAGSIVTLKGQDVECVGTGLNGIRMVGVGVTLHVHKVQIRNCRGSNGNGIEIAHSSGQAKVFVTDSYITNNGATVGTAGLRIRPTGGGTCNVVVRRVQFEANLNGIFMDGAGGAGACNLVVNESTMSGSQTNGIAVASAGGAFVATVANSTISSNVNVGAAVANAAATLRLGGNIIASNVTGVSNAGGTLQSFKNNMIVGNLADGTPITAFPGPGGAPLQ